MRIDLCHADIICVQLDGPYIIFVGDFQIGLSHRDKVWLIVAILLIHLHPYELGIGTVEREINGATDGWAGSSLELCKRPADGTVDRQIHHLAFLAAVVRTVAVAARVCLLMTWTNKALLPVMVLVMLHRAQIAIDSFVELQDMCKNEVVDGRRQRK